MLLEEILFPIQGPERELLLILEWLIVLIFFQASIIIYVGSRKVDKKERNQQEIAYTTLFMGYSILWVFTILSEYYCENIDERVEIYSIGVLIIVFFGIFFFYKMDKAQVISNKFLFTKISLISAILIILLFFLNKGAMMALAFIFAASTLFFFFLIYLSKLRKNIYIRQILTHFGLKFIIFSIGVISMAVGFLFTRYEFISRFGLVIRFIGDFLQIIAITFIFIFLSSVPTLEEYEWIGKINRLFLMRRSGICVYYRFFKEEKEKVDKQLVSMAIQTINLMLEEFTEKEGISIIEKKTSNFIIQPSKNFTAVLICDIPLKSLKILLNRFIIKVETIYQNVLEATNISTEIFQPIESMVKEIFLI